MPLRSALQDEMDLSIRSLECRLDRVVPYRDVCAAKAMSALYHLPGYSFDVGHVLFAQEYTVVNIRPVFQNEFYII